MSSLDFCVKEDVEVTRLQGRGRLKGAYRYGLLAVHKSINERRGWTITHLPTGLCMTTTTGLFPTAEAAASAMIEIAKLRNDWLHLGDEPMPELRDAVRAIGQEHGGRRDQLAANGFRGRSYKANADLCARFV